MRLTQFRETMLIAAVIAFGAVACKDDKTNTPTDAGHDSGRTDSGVDAQVIPPVYLRVAHLAFGSGVGPVHICALAADGSGIRTLITTDGLSSGNLTSVTPQSVPYGSITRHVAIPSQFLQVLDGQTLEVYRESETTPGTLTVGTQTIATCNPNFDGGIAALASVKVGTGGTPLVPGTYYSLVFTGSIGNEFNGTPGCNAAGPTFVCAPTDVTLLTDERTAPDNTKARVRVVVADPRTGAMPGFCSAPLDTTDMNQGYLIGTKVDTAGAGLHSYLSDATLPAYFNIARLGRLDAGVNGNNDAGFFDILFTTHSNVPSGDAAVLTDDPPCGLNPDLPGFGLSTAGTIPNEALAGAYADAGVQGSPVATIRNELAPNQVSTLFVSPYPTRFIDLTTLPTITPCNPVYAGQAAPNPMCQPRGGVCDAICLGPTAEGACTAAVTLDPVNNPTPSAGSSVGCVWLPVAVPVADDTP